MSSSSSYATKSDIPSDLLLINLEILGKVLPGSKLYKDPHTNLLAIEKPSFFSGVSRRWNGFGRKQTVLLIAEIVKDSITCQPTVLLQERIKKAQTGISCLMNTYEEDTSTVSELSLLLHKLKCYDETFGPSVDHIKKRN